MTRRIHSKARNLRVKTGLAIGVSTLLCLAVPAFAEEGANATDPASTTLTSPAISPTKGLNFNLPGTLPSSDFGLRLDMPSDAIGSTLYQFDLSDPTCVSGEGLCLRRSDGVDVGLSKDFLSLSEKGLDLSVSPRAALRFDEDSQSTRLGATFEIGDDLSDGFRSNTWYVFAGADAEQVNYGPNAIGRLNTGPFYLQDSILVGDAQAGVGYRLGDTDVSLSYSRREARGDDITYKENAAALSFTWKR